MPAALLALLLCSAPVLHVDAASPPGGDGSAARPFSRVGEALAAAPAGATLMLEPGLYEEALLLERPVRLQGSGKTVLAAPPGSAVALRIRAEATLQDLAVQGGRVGIALEAGRATLQRVAVRGQPEVGLDCGALPCSVSQGSFQSSFASAVGLRSAGPVELESVSFEGPFRRALELKGARLRGRAVQVTGSATGLQAEAAEVDLAELEVSEARVAGVFASAGRVTLREPILDRCGYGVLSRNGARVELSGAIVVGSLQAGVAAVKSSVVLRDHVHLGPANDAALVFESSEVRIADALLRSPGPAGVRARLGHTRLLRLTVLDAALEGGGMGDAVFGYDTALEATDLQAVRCPGAAVEVQLGSGWVRGLVVQQAGLASVALEHEAQLDVAGLLQRGGRGVGVACTEGGRGRFSAPRVEGAQGGAWLVDCSCALRVSPAGAGPLRCGGELPGQQSDGGRGP